MSYINILHISDLHFSTNSYPNLIREKTESAIRYVGRLNKPSFDFDKAIDLARWVYQNQAKFHILLITGDLADTGKVDDLSVARDFLTRPSSDDVPWMTNDGMPTLSFLKNHIILLPGNHDRYDCENERKPRSLNFDNVFSDYWGYGQRIRARGGRVSLKESKQGLWVISVDFSLEQENHAYELGGYLGQGYVYESVLVELENVVKSCRERDKDSEIVLAIHYDYDVERSLFLIDQEKFLDKLNCLNINYVFAGHTHKPKIHSVSEHKTFIVAGSAVANKTFFLDKPITNSFHLIQASFGSADVKMTQLVEVFYEQRNKEFKTK